MKFPDTLNVYGDQSYRGPCPTENAEQITFFNVLRRDYPQLGKIALHIKNEGKRNIHQAIRDKAEGMVTGASDIVIPGKPSFVCELKRLDHTKSVWQPGQQDYLEECQIRGSFVCVALGHKAALSAVDFWLRRF